MPGRASLAAGEYYAHPQNAFWHIMLTLLGDAHMPLPPYAWRRQRLMAAGIALWDVYAACERRGSLDSAIVAGSGQLNDLAALLRQAPDIALIATNGGRARQVFCRHWRDLPVATLFLPSTSAANARMPPEQKLAAWAALAPFLLPNGAA